jgi:GAF domain-containing protein
VSISHLRGRSLVSASSNDDVGLVLDGIQTGAQQGPCLDAIRTGEVMVAGDLRDDPRWPEYGPRAAESTGVLSSLAMPLHDGQRTLGALNLFAEAPGAFAGDPEQEGLVAVLAAHATSALAAALHREDMAAALRNRDVIGQAKGMLMARSALDEDAAFDVLVRASQRTNVKVAEIARRLVAGTLGDEA